MGLLFYSREIVCTLLVQPVPGVRAGLSKNEDNTHTKQHWLTGQPTLRRLLLLSLQMLPLL